MNPWGRFGQPAYIGVMECVYCDGDLTGGAARAAFDPWLGRLWRVCPTCGRWNVVPLDARWEELERYERAARDGRSRLRTPHLDLVTTPGGELIRVGRAPRPELAGWRYGDAVPPARTRGPWSWLRRALLGLPSAPFGYQAGHGELLADHAASRRWFASPFLEDAPVLTAAFLHVPLADACPSCGGPLAVAPWSFQAIRLTTLGGRPAAAAVCGVCGEEVAVATGEARAALRLGLSLVNRGQRARVVVEAAATIVDGADGPDGLLAALSREEVSLGELDVRDRLALGFALDEQSEAELLEDEWRTAEELAAIVDRELTEVPGFEEFRRRVLE